MVNLRNGLTAAVLIIGLLYCSWGITTVTPRLVAADASATATDALMRLVHGTPFRTNFLKGGNLHTHLVALSGLGKYKELTNRHQPRSKKETLKLLGNNISIFLLRARLISLVSAVLGLFLLIKTLDLIFPPPAGLLGGLLLGTNLAYAHWAHLATEDMLSTALLIGSFYFLAKFMTGGMTRYLFFSSIAGGLALSAKATAGMILLPLLYAVYSECETKRHRKALTVLCWLSLAYLATTPSILVYPAQYVRGLAGEVSNRWAYKGFTAYYPGWIIHFLNLARAFSSPLFAGLIVSATSLVFISLTGVQSRFRQLCLLFLLPYFLLIGTWDKMNPDYVLPLVPFVVLLGTGGFVLLLRRQHWQKGLVITLAVLLGFSSWYTAEAIGTVPLDSRLLAERYIRSRLPASASVDTYSHKQYLPRFPDNIEVKNFSLMGKPGNEWHLVRKRVREKTPGFILMVSSHYARYLKYPHVYPVVTRTFKRLLKERTGYRIEKRFGADPITDYTLWTYVELTLDPRSFRPFNPTVVMLRRK